MPSFLISSQLESLPAILCFRNRVFLVFLFLTLSLLTKFSLCSIFLFQKTEIFSRSFFLFCCYFNETEEQKGEKQKQKLLLLFFLYKIEGRLELKLEWLYRVKRVNIISSLCCEQGASVVFAFGQSPGPSLTPAFISCFH